jgi:hypothetical protein
VTLRLPIIAAFGGDQQPAEAFALGRALAKTPVVILTGGEPVDSSAVKDRVPLGAFSGLPNGSVP